MKTKIRGEIADVRKRLGKGLEPAKRHVVDGRKFSTAEVAESAEGWKKDTGGTPVARDSSSLAEIPLDAIVARCVGGSNPRKNFPRAEIETLAQTMIANKDAGRRAVDQALIVRELSAIDLARAGRKGSARREPTYELIDGERRLRAAQVAQLATVPCEVRDVSDEEADEISLRSFLQKRDISDVEKAEAYNAWLAHPGRTQAWLAAELGVDPSTISNTLRLLELPETWRDWVADGSITARHARAVMPVIGFPAIEKEIRAELARDISNDKTPSVAEFESIVEENIKWKSEPMTGTEWQSIGGQHGHVPIFEPTEAQREKLAIVSLGGEQRATNVKLWKSLMQAHAREYFASREAGKKKGQGGQSPAKKKKPKPLTPAEEKAREKQRKEQFAKRLAHWRADWLRLLSARVLRGNAEVAIAIAPKLLAFALCDNGVGLFGMCSLHRRPEAEKQFAKHLKVSVRQSTCGTYEMLGDAATENEHYGQTTLQFVAARVFADWLWDDEADQAGPLFDDALVDHLARDLGVDMEGAWRLEQAGPLSLDFWRLFSKDELSKRAGEDDGITKEGLIQLLTEADVPFPKEIKPLAAAKEIISREKKPAKGKRPAARKGAK